MSCSFRNTFFAFSWVFSVLFPCRFLSHFYRSSQMLQQVLLIKESLMVSHVIVFPSNLLSILFRLAITWLDAILLHPTMQELTNYYELQIIQYLFFFEVTMLSTWICMYMHNMQHTYRHEVPIHRKWRKIHALISIDNLEHMLW